MRSLARRTLPVRFHYAVSASALVVLAASCGSNDDHGQPQDGGDGGLDAAALNPDGAPSTDGGGCAPRTCVEQQITCGPAGDGCGSGLQCGSCTPPETCGGGGTPSTCGNSDGGPCLPRTCAGLGYNCGPAGDGCGGALSCGSCMAPLTCGGGGQPSVCGAPSGHSVLLQWTASATAGVTYDAYRSPGCTGTYAMEATGITTTTWTDTAVTSGQKYCYVTTAVNPVGQSMDSNTAQAVIP
jgi:hypothetical protein